MMKPVINSFSPLSLSPALWLDAADASTVTLVSGAVSQWADKSGNGRHVYEATERPTYNANGLATGKAGIVFASGNKLTSTVSIDGAGNTLYLVGKLSTSALAAFFTYRLTALIRSYQAGAWSDGRYYLTGDGVNGSFNMSTTNTSAITANPFVSAFVQLNSAPTYFLNETQIVTHDATTLNSLTGSSGFQVGNRPDFAGQPLIGAISEILSFPVVHTVAQRQQVAGYLAWKWGTVATLPGGHPYKNSAP